MNPRYRAIGPSVRSVYTKLKYIMHIRSSQLPIIELNCEEAVKGVGVYLCVLLYKSLIHHAALHKTEMTTTENTA